MKRAATRSATAIAAADNFDAAAMRRHSVAAARLMRSLGNRQRLLVLCALAEGELSVGELNDRVTLSQSALSQHLAVLRSEQLVTTRRDAQTIHYSLAQGPAVRVLQLLHDEFCETAQTKRGR
jgi:DNA-binding transcriptional ArsR family regulator